MGEGMDFLEKETEPEESKEAFPSSETNGEHRRNSRQLLPFSSFQPFEQKSLPEAGGISFQRIRIGPTETTPNLASIQPHITFNDLNFEGFKVNQPLSSSTNSITNQT